MFEDTVGSSETTEPVVETPSVETPDAAQVAPTSPSDGMNPAWKPLLDKLPESLHGMVTPTLREWDSGVENRFKTVQSEYEPYKQFVADKVDPQQIQAAMQVAAIIRDNPRFVFDKMVEQFGDEWGLNEDQGEFEDDEQPDEYDESGQPTFNLESNPAFQQVQSQMEAIAQFTQSQQEAAERAKLDEAINRDFQAASEKYGELSQQDVEMIGSIALGNNITVTQAADRLFGYSPRQAAATPNRLPNIVAPGGGQPAQLVNPTTLDGKDTKALVAQLLNNSLGHKD